LALLDKPKEALDVLLPLAADPERGQNGSLQALCSKILAGMGRWREAEPYIDKALAIEPENVTALMQKGLNLALRGALDAKTEAERTTLYGEAKRYLSNSARLGLKDALIHSTLAMLYEREGDTVNAAAHRERSCQLSPRQRGCPTPSKQPVAPKAEAKSK
jgi:predicted Zn-dependent protease